MNKRFTIYLSKRTCFEHDVAYRVLKNQLEEHLPIKCYVVKLLILLRVLNMINIKKVLPQSFMNFSIKIHLLELLHLHGQGPQLLEINLQSKTKLCIIKNQQNKYTTKLLEHLRKGKYTHLLQTIFGVQIQQIYN